MKIAQYLVAAMIGAASLGMAGCATHDNGQKQTAGEYIDDATITSKVKAKFVEDKTVSAMRIHVDTNNGVVQLSGSANNDTEKSRAAEIARNVKGVKDVKNDIIVKS